MQLKITRSIISTESVVYTVLNKYLFTETLNCKLIKACGSSDTYLLNTGTQKYILKIFSQRNCWPYTREHYLTELQLITFLYNNNISVSNPIENKERSYLSTINAPEYEKFLAIYSFLDGCNFIQNSSNERLYQLGRKLAILHQTAQSFKSKIKHKRNLDLDFLLSKPKDRIFSLNNLEISDKFKKNVVNIFNKLMERANSCNLYNLQSGIIHGDMHLGNHFYKTSNKTISFFDFELSGHGFFIYDLATILWNLKLLYLGKNKSSQKAFQHVMNGYQSFGTLNKDELDNIEFFAKIRHFFFIGSSFILYPELVETHNEHFINNELEKFKKL